MLAGLLGAAVAVLPSLAAGSSSPSSASYTAVDFQWEANGDSSAQQVTIAQGGTVTFGYPSGNSEHDADFGTTGPTSCSPALPAQPSAPGWSSTCRFDTPGTYTFHCDLHSFMTGTVVVQGPGGTTTGTTTTGSTTTTSTTPSTTTTSTTTTSPAQTTQTTPPTKTTTSASNPRHPAATVSIVRRQHGRRVAGALDVTSAYRGGTLTVDVYASARSLGLRRGGLVRVGHLIRTALRLGREHFTVPLRRLSHRRPLLLRVRAAVRSPAGHVSRSTRAVLLQR